MSDMDEQYEMFIKYKSENESGGPIDMKNMYVWRIHFDGPKNSDYEGGKYHVKVEFHKDNLNLIPKCIFENEEFIHPNIYDNGEVCFGSDISWDKDHTILDLLSKLIFLLKYPNFNSGYHNKQIKEFFEKDPEEYHRIVKEIVQEFHK